MKIQSIKFVRPFLGKRYILVSLSSGNAYKIKISGKYAVVIPTCQENEKEALRAAYRAAWEFLMKGKTGEPGLDRTAKQACARLVGFIDWPDYAPVTTEGKLNFLVHHFTQCIDM